jgi:hypothetical protein
VFDADVTWQTVVEKLAVELPLIDTFPKDVLPTAGQERGSAYNQAFALAVNRWLVREQVYFDLVVVDEAQCLRNLEGQQTNTVLQTLLRQRARHWLFISATPAHSGVANIATVLNSYAEHRGRVPIPSELLQREDNYLALQKRLREFMIRRPRTFLIKGETVRKQQYRRDDTESLALDCTDPLGILSIGLVQKKLVEILGSARNPNTFRSGYVASFESLEDSVQHRQLLAASKQREQGEEQAETDIGDFYTDRHVRHEESRAPDEGFVSEMNRDFSGRFGFSLPHPKLDAVEQDLATRAFGSRAQIAEGGQKTVVFCRRVSSVRVLRERLLHRYLASIEDRCRSYWKLELDWKHGLPGDRRQPIEAVADAPEDDAQIGVGAEDHRNLLRAAQSEGQWLYNFRVSFNDGYRNALFFEINWFERLCREAGCELGEAIQRVPAELWAEARAYATSGGKLYRRRQFRYVVWHALDRFGAQVFGFSSPALRTWRRRLGHVLQLRGREPARALGQVQAEPALLSFPCFWVGMAEYDLSLPGSEVGSCDEAVYCHKIVATILGQYMRLTDTLVDLRCADLQAVAKDSSQGSMLQSFTSWLLSEDIDAKRLRQVCADWAKHHAMLLSNLAETAGKASSQLAEAEHFGFLAGLEPVVGIAGSAGGHKQAIQQFNMPGMPYVMAGTDTIREGVNLHLFCDRVMHFGMPWTAGDLEQRIGRVDRYFGRIERRLREPGAEPGKVSLDVLYPYLKDTLERQQIETIMSRKRATDAAVDAPPIEHHGVDDIIRLDVLPERPKESTGRASILFGTERHLHRYRK